jgi:hypothetical protein
MVLAPLMVLSRRFLHFSGIPVFVCLFCWIFSQKDTGFLLYDISPTYFFAIYRLLRLHDFLISDDKQMVTNY